MVIFLSKVPRLALALIAIAGGVVLTFGSTSKWRSTTSLHWLQHAVPFVPLQAYGVLLILHGLLLMTVRTRPAGYALGAGLAMLFAVSLIATLHQSGPKSIVFLVVVLQLVMFNIMAIDVSAEQREGQR